MKLIRKEMFSLLSVTAFLLSMSAFSLSAYAAPAEPFSLNPDELFTEARSDLETLADLSGAEHITVTDGQDADLSAAGIWIIDGTASDVTISVNAPEDAAVYLLLSGVSIVNADRPCIYVGSAGKVYLSTVGDSTLTVREKFRKEPGREASAVIYSCTDLTLCGGALLTVDSPKNGVLCKDTLRILDGDYAVTAASKAVAANNAVWIAGGNFRLKAAADGLHAENEDDGRKGSIYIGGGSFDIDAADDGIYGQTQVRIDDGMLAVTAAEGVESTRVLISGGDLYIRASDDGVNAGFKSDAYRPKIEITGGAVTIDMDGEGSDALDSNADMVISGGTVSVTGAGIDWDGELSFTGGTVIMEGEAVTEIPNASTHSLK